MVLGVFLNSILAFVWTIVLLYHFGDPEAIENAPGGLAIIGVYMSATGSRAVTTLFVVFKMYTLYISLFNILASVARLTWAFSQNNGLPFSRFFSFVSGHFPGQPMSWNTLTRDPLAGFSKLSYADTGPGVCFGHMLPPVSHQYWQHHGIQCARFAAPRRSIY